MSFYLAIVSPLDAPLFELTFTSTRPAQTTSTSNSITWSSFTGSTANGDSEAKTGPAGVLNGLMSDRALCQMVAHASLDSVEEVMEGTGSL